LEEMLGRNAWQKMTLPTSGFFFLAARGRWLGTVSGGQDDNKQYKGGVCHVSIDAVTSAFIR
jgi:hypothetical protein